MGLGQGKTVPPTPQTIFKPPLEAPSHILAQVLQYKCEQDEGRHNDISVEVFVRYLFPSYPELGEKLFHYFLHTTKHRSRALTVDIFTAQCDRLLSLLTDDNQRVIYLMVFANCSTTVVKNDQFKDLLLVIYKIAMYHYPEGPQTCRQLLKTVQSIVDSAFHRKEAVSLGYLKAWISAHCPRLIDLLHRYVVHILSTTHRCFKKNGQFTRGTYNKTLATSQELELSTPVLEKELGTMWDASQPLLPVSQVWILATTLPTLYTKPSHQLCKTNSAALFRAKLTNYLDMTYPSHWTLLYNSSQHGLGTNRFLHHVVSYKGPTLTFIRGEQDVELCIGSTEEWHESHQYWGEDDCIIVQILPHYHVVQRGPKMIYMNFGIRGYPKGIRAGKDPRLPLITVDDSFTHVTFFGVPYKLLSIEVWGCGSPRNREVQLDVRKWQVKEAEKQRVVKMSTSDWADHPDRYLLELAGRTSSSSDFSSNN